MSSRTTDVTICIPTYNAEKTLRETVESVLAQTYQDFEILLQDNASTDGTWQMMQDMAKRDSRIKPFRNDSNLGMIGNWNVVFERAKLPFTLLLSADDCLLPEFLEVTVRELKAEPTLINVSVDHWLFSDSHQRARKIQLNEGTYKNHADIVLLKNPFSINFTLFNRENLKQLIGARAPFRHFMTCDYDLHILIAISGRSVKYIDQKLARYRLHDANLSKQRKRMTRQAALTVLSHKQALESKFNFVYRLTLVRFLSRALLFPLRGVEWDARFVGLLVGRLIKGAL
jgi:glycosyltransferase involved in cell wall biosynthesis